MNKPCKHPAVVYLGEQETLQGKTISLYNCIECMSTITNVTTDQLANSIRHHLK